MTHTSGPWATNTNIYPEDQVFDATGKIVADCKWTPHTFDQREANARLIAAAPELVEALRSLLAADHGLIEIGFDAEVEKARALLARVEAK